MKTESIIIITIIIILLLLLIGYAIYYFVWGPGHTPPTPPTPPAPTPPAQPTNKLVSNDNNTLNEGQSLNNGKYQLIMQPDGNLVEYDPAFTWNSNTPGKGTPPRTLIMQTDGNLCVQDKNNMSTWCTNTASKGSGPWSAVLNADSTFCVYDSNSTPTWCNSSK